MQIFDAHLDMAWNATDWNRDLNKPIAEIRAFENQFQLPGIVDGDATVSWPELLRGGVCTIIATLLARLNRREVPPCTAASAQTRRFRQRTLPTTSTTSCTATGSGSLRMHYPRVAWKRSRMGVKRRT